MIRLVLSVLLVTTLVSCSQKKEVDCEAVQAAAKAELHKVHASMMEAGAMSMKYPIDIGVLEKKYKLVLEPGDYDFRIASASADKFVVEARGNGEMTGDVWRIDEKGVLTALSEKCK